MRPAAWKANDPVFPAGIPRNARLRLDLSAANVDDEDGLGRKIDFHALVVEVS